MRCQNLNRKQPGSDPEAPSAKRVKIDTPSHHYPSLAMVSEDETSDTRNLQLLQQESRKSKPRLETLQELMHRTISKRREWILDDVKPVTEICEKYPPLSKPSVVRMLYFYPLYNYRRKSL